MATSTTGGGGKTPVVTKEQGELRSLPAIDRMAQVRDLITGFVGKGYTSLSDDESRAAYLRLKTLMGANEASSMLNHIMVFNQRPDVQKSKPENKIMQFYSMGSANPEVNSTIKKAGIFGYGPVVGMRESPDMTNRQLSTGIVENPVLAQSNTRNIINQLR